jgi:hypothetical protein
MNRTLKEATLRRYHYDTHEASRAHLRTFLEAYNFATCLKRLGGFTPFEFVAGKWTSERHRFSENPAHLTLGPNNSSENGSD